jgi:hypothetical protein
LKNRGLRFVACAPSRPRAVAQPGAAAISTSAAERSDTAVDPNDPRLRPFVRAMAQLIFADMKRKGEI